MTWISSKLNSLYHDGWSWVSALDRQEWLMVLLVVTVLGFLCMRGYGSRNNY